MRGILLVAVLGGSTGVENVTGSAYADRLGGDNGPNALRGMNGDDELLGFSGDDTLYGGNGVDHLAGGAGFDTLIGGPGDDVYKLFYWDGDAVIEQAGEGTDWVLTDSPYVLPANVEHIWLTPGAEGANATGNDLGNILYGNQFDNVLRGEDGNDHINPLEGADTLHGGNGADSFLWETVEGAGLTRATADRILDFSFAEGDRINISAIDADVYAGGNQAFTFIGNAAFSGTPGELNYVHADGNTYIQMQTGTSPDVEGVIRIDGIVTPQASWFVL